MYIYIYITGLFVKLCSSNIAGRKSHLAGLKRVHHKHHS